MAGLQPRMITELLRMRKGWLDLSPWQRENSQPRVFKQMCRSAGQPVVPRLWVAPGCGAPAPDIVLFVILALGTNVQVCCLCGG